MILDPRPGYDVLLELEVWGVWTSVTVMSLSKLILKSVHYSDQVSLDVRR